MEGSIKDKATPSSSPWQHRVHPMTSSSTDSPGLEAKKYLLSWDADWSETGAHTDDCSVARCQGQPLAKDPLPVVDHGTSQEPSVGPLGRTSAPSEESSHSNRTEEEQSLTEKGCYDRGKEQLQTGGKAPGGNTFEPPKRRSGPCVPALCAPYAFNSPLYRPYPYVHGRYGNSESPIASLQCGLNKIPKESEKQTNCLDSERINNDTQTCAKTGTKKKKSKNKNTTKVRVKQPENYMGVAILICVLFNCPMGVAAILVSRSASKHFTEGDMAGGRHRALCSLVLSLVAIVVSVLVVIMVVFLVAANSK